ncbi:MAG: hypothetical protein AB7P20_08365 [Rhizobiaceae bacterium]
MSEIELHFQEAFSGETIQILLNGKLVAERSMKTRYQTGLAHIEKLDAKPGDEIEVRVAGKGISSKVNIVDSDKNTSNYKVIMKDGRIFSEYSKDPLLYL